MENEKLIPVIQDYQIFFEAVKKEVGKDTLMANIILTRLNKEKAAKIAELESPNS